MAKKKRQPDKSRGRVKRHRKPVSEETLTDMESFFSRNDQVAYVFLAGEGHVNDDVGHGPSFGAAAELAFAALEDGSFDGPFRISWIAPESADDRPSTEDVKKAVQARVQELRRRKGVSFVLCWSVYGDTRAHLDFSDDLNCDEVRGELVSYLKDTVSWVCP